MLISSWWVLLLVPCLTAVWILFLITTITLDVVTTDSGFAEDHPGPHTPRPRGGRGGFPTHPRIFCDRVVTTALDQLTCARGPLEMLRRARARATKSESVQWFFSRRVEIFLSGPLEMPITDAREDHLA